MSTEPTQNPDGQWEAEAKDGGGNNVAVIAVVLAVVGVGCLCGIGVLSAIAIPNFLAMQLRAKRSEAPTNLDGIRTAEKAYHAEWDAFTTVGPCPPFVPGREQVFWDSTWDCASSFEYLGWTPAGAIRCQYTVTAMPGVETEWGTDDFVGTATCDIDGDGRFTQYEATRDSRSYMVSPNNVY